MNGLEFVASLVGSLAWPSFALIVFLLLRKPLKDLLPLLQRLKYKEIELEFRRRVEDVSAEVAEELPQVAADAVPPELEAMARMAEVSPRAAVLESWRRVEIAAIEAARRLKLGPLTQKAGTLSRSAIWFLEHDPTYDRSIGAVLRELRSLRNQAAHAPEFALSKDAALDYAASASRVASYLDTLGNPA